MFSPCVLACCCCYFLYLRVLSYFAIRAVSCLPQVILRGGVDHCSRTRAKKADESIELLLFLNTEQLLQSNFQNF
jgi:hypothetical protein